MSEPRSNSERRRFVRQAFALPIWVEAASVQAANFFQIVGSTRDVSNRGLYFWSPVCPQVGQLLRLKLDLQADSSRKSTLHIHWEAEVVRIEPGKAGQEVTGVAARILRFDIPRVFVSTERVN